MMIIQDLPREEIDRLLSEIVKNNIIQRLSDSRPGHCLRISTLPEKVMIDLCAELNQNGKEADVVLLLGHNQHPSQAWQITSSRLIELRNAEERPLLVFIPPGLKAAAEDSFDVSTFVEIDLGDMPVRLQKQLREQLPDELRSLTDRVVHYLTRVERNVNADDVVRYYLTLLKNEATKEAAGGAIYQVNLIPDFTLFDIPERIEQRLDRNAVSLHTLVESNQPLLGRIHELRLKPNTLQTDLYNFLKGKATDAVSKWGRLIATDSISRNLSFDQWPFEGEVIDRDQLLLYVDGLDLPSRDKDAPIGPDNPLYLDVMRTRSVRLRWETNPKPSTLPDLAYFRIEIVSSEGAVSWESKNFRNSASTRAYRTKRLNIADFRHQVEDGLYYFRIRAYSESGEILNEENAEEHPEVLRDHYNPEGKRIYESEDVWFWVDEDAPPPAEPQRNIVINSFLDAKLQVQFAAIDRGDDPFSDRLIPRPEKTGWATAKGKRAEAIYNIVYDAQARFTFPVSNLLRRIESDTLTHPDMLGRWRLNFLDGETLFSVQPMVRQFRNIKRVPDRFIQARSAVFNVIRGDGDNLTSTVDLLQFDDLIQDYADAYSDWLDHIQKYFDEQAILEEDGRRRTAPIFLDLDTVEVILPNGTSSPDRVYLLAPTHPIRLLWHLQLAQMAQTWIKSAIQDGRGEELLPQAVRLFLRQGLIPINLPPMIRSARDSYPEGVSHFYMEQGPLNLFWNMFVREDSRDNRALRARVQKALGISRQSSTINSIGTISKEVLTQKFSRYLMQHPYVQLFKINAFNPGDAALIVDAILGVEKARTKQGLPLLRYELRLFSQSSGLVDIGEAFDDLVNPERQVSPEADAFAIPSQNHLFPKLRFSRNSFSDFFKKPEDYEAHITILHDVFPINVELGTLHSGRSSYVHGLIQEQLTEFTGDQQHYAWQKQLIPKACQELPGDQSQISKKIALLLSQVSNLQASIAVGKKVDNVVPTLKLKLAIQDKNLLYQVHAVSDWVFIIDRHLGLEYFDSELSPDRIAYLLDFAPEFGNTDTDRLLLTTRSIDEIIRLIHPILEDYDLLTGEGVETFFLQLLRSLSGRLAFKLLASPTQVSEALGLAMARLFLEQYGLLDDSIVLPLDAHSALFIEAGKEVPLETDISLQRGDLLLVNCDPASRLIRFHIIEVKWRANLGDLSAYVSLRQDIEKQIMDSDEALRIHFDPHNRVPDRVDRQVKTKELISLLLFYLERSRRYGLISGETAASLRPFIENLDEGYQITCAGTGVIFDMSHQEISDDIEHAGLAFYRIGHDYVRRLLDNGLRRKILLQEQVKQKVATIEDAELRRETREKIVRNTSMREDKSYHRIRSQFRTPIYKNDINREEGELVEQETLNVEIPQPEELGEISSKDSLEKEVQIQDSVETPDLKEAVISEPPPIEEVFPEEEYKPVSDVLLGDTYPSDQYGLLGRAAGKIVALDLNGTNTISLFGVQGGGKSYTVGSIVEMATQSIPGINFLPSPLATVIFHYHESQDYPPEFVSMLNPNKNEEQIRELINEYHAQPQGLDDVILLTSADKLMQRKAEFSFLKVEPIYFSSSELSFKDWRFLMGVAGNQMYMKQINMIMRQLRDRLTLATLQQEIEDSPLSDAQKHIARIRLNFAAQFIQDNRQLENVLRPGRLIIVDLRDEFIDKDEALGLFVVMLNIFANAGREESFNKLIVFDEAHKYMDNPDLTGHIVDVIRQMRHQGVSVLIASQDPPSLPNAIIELSSLVILHRFNSPQWLKHVQRSVTALADLTPAEMASLRPGDAYVWATKATERIFNQKAVKMRFRPRVTQHGGETKKAV